MDGSTLLLGSDHATWGEYSLAESGQGRSAAALSVGADPRSPSMANKASRLYPNEDALLVADQGPLTLLAVADAHHGHQASHTLLEALANSGPAIPRDREALDACLASLRFTVDPPDSGTTLLVAVLDRGTGRGFGTSFGDSSLVRVDAAGAEYLSLRRASYLRANAGAGLDPADGLPLEFGAGDGALLVAFTDGVDECHYHSPSTSVGPGHLHELFDRTGARAPAFAAALVELALAGIDGHPGGQDNIAVAVTATGGGR